jgi:hypothetical protein
MATIVDNCDPLLKKEPRKRDALYSPMAPPIIAPKMKMPIIEKSLRRVRVIYHFLLSYLLIDEIRVCLESGLLILTFYPFWPLLSIKLYKIVDSISCFPCNSIKCELRIT